MVTLSIDPTLLVAAVSIVAALALMLVVVLTRTPNIPLSRRRPDAPVRRSQVATVTDALTGLLGRIMSARGSRLSAAITGSGIRLPARDVVFLTLCAVVVAFAGGLLLKGPVFAVAMTLVPPLAVWLLVRSKTTRRHRRFADQLDETTQLLAGSLRAGYSFNQALVAVSRESESPTSEEFSRINNEVRLGRPLGESLLACGDRMRSEDFYWLAQAVAINREVGGNLADVLDNVGTTIRERSELHRRVRALSSEGRLSAIVLMGLPIVVGLGLAVLNPTYVSGFTSSAIGYLMLVAIAVLLIVGGFWLRAMITIKY